MSKGSRNRTTNFRQYQANFDKIDWGKPKPRLYNAGCIIQRTVTAFTQDEYDRAVAMGGIPRGTAISP